MEGNVWGVGEGVGVWGELQVLGFLLLLTGIAVLPLQRLGDQALSDRPCRSFDPLWLAVDHCRDCLQVGLESPLGAAGDLLTDTAQILSPTAITQLVSRDRAEAGEITDAGHDSILRVKVRSGCKIARTSHHKSAMHSMQAAHLGILMNTPQWWIHVWGA